MNNIDIFKEVLCYFSLMRQLFHCKLFSRNCTLRGKDNVQLFLMSHIYSMCDVFLTTVKYVFELKQLLDFNLISIF